MQAFPVVLGAGTEAAYELLVYALAPLPQPVHELLQLVTTNALVAGALDDSLPAVLVFLDFAFWRRLLQFSEVVMAQLSKNCKATQPGSFTL